MNDVVYIITKKDLRNGLSEIVKVYGESAKQLAKDRVDQLNNSVLDDDDIDYVLDSYDVVN